MDDIGDIGDKLKEGLGKVGESLKKGKDKLQDADLPGKAKDLGKRTKDGVKKVRGRVDEEGLKALVTREHIVDPEEQVAEISSYLDVLTSYEPGPRFNPVAEFDFPRTLLVVGQDAEVTSDVIERSVEYGRGIAEEKGVTYNVVRVDGSVRAGNNVTATRKNLDTLLTQGFAEDSVNVIVLEEIEKRFPDFTRENLPDYSSRAALKYFSNRISLQGRERNYKGNWMVIATTTDPKSISATVQKSFFDDEI